MNKNISLENLEQQIKSLPSAQDGAMLEIIKGMYQGKPLLGQGGLLTNLVKELTQVALQGEMDSHLNDVSLEEGGNRRNGTKAKTVKGPIGFI
jgi:transposase-like protein